jgi:hypothetical protein
MAGPLAPSAKSLAQSLTAALKWLSAVWLGYAIKDLRGTQFEASAAQNWTKSLLAKSCAAEFCTTTFDDFFA